MKHVFILYSPKKEHPFISTIHEVMKGLDYEIRLSEYLDHASDIVREYREPTRFYSVGGDGMVNQVMQKIVNTAHELVIIPYGTGNDFVRIIYHQKSPKKILEESLYKRSQKVDVLKINERYGMNSTCFGIDASIANTVHEKSRFNFIPSRYGYIVGILRRIRDYDFPHLQLVTKGNVVFDDDVSLCALMNGVFYGGGFAIAPFADIKDGLMEVVALKRINKVTFPKYVALIVRKKLSTHPDVITLKVKEIDVYTSASANIDGDEFPAPDYHVEVIPQALQLVF